MAKPDYTLQTAGIPIEKVSSDESERLIKMEETLHTRVIGQEEAVVAISRAIRRARVGMQFLFAHDLHFISITPAFAWSSTGRGCCGNPQSHQQSPCW